MLPYRSTVCQVLTGALLLPLCSCFSAADGNIGRLEAVWGKRGLMPGEFTKPRAIAIDAQDRLYIVDFRAMIQVFTNAGEYITGWETPTHTIGRPSGLAIDHEGHLLVADSHYHQILYYSSDGQLLRRLGGDSGDGPLVGEFGYIGDIAVDSKGLLYVAESQQKERITKMTPAGKILKQWGGRGPMQGQFSRIRALVFDAHDQLYVADACNHRVQVFDTDGQLLRIIGAPGLALGQLDYPYDVAIAPDGTLYVCEYGNNRVQRFTPEGESLGVWGKAGRGPGELFNPWALAVDHQGKVHVVDSNNHRVQRVVF